MSFCLDIVLVEGQEWCLHCNLCCCLVVAMRLGNEYNIYFFPPWSKDIALLPSSLLISRARVLDSSGIGSSMGCLSSNHALRTIVLRKSDILMFCFSNFTWCGILFSGSKRILVVVTFLSTFHPEYFWSQCKPPHLSITSSSWCLFSLQR